MPSEAEQKAAKPDAQQKATDACKMAASNRDCIRAGRRGYDPQIAKQIAWGE